MAEIFRYRRKDEVRVYDLRIVPGGTELWRVTSRPGQPDAEIKEDEFKSRETALECFAEIERALTAGGWREG